VFGRTPHPFQFRVLRALFVFSSALLFGRFAFVAFDLLISLGYPFFCLLACLLFFNFFLAPGADPFASRRMEPIFEFFSFDVRIF